MYVSQLTLHNVRQFDFKDFSFKPGFNLLVGENGAGKTTLLRALLAVLGSAKQTGRKPALTDEDIRLRTRELEIGATIVAEGDENFTFHYSKHFGARAKRPRNGPHGWRSS